MKLAVGQLIDEASAATDLGDFGPASYEEGLRVLIDSAEAEANLSEIGRTRLAGMIRSRLENRLHLYDWHRRNPEIAEQDVAAPVIVTGLWRTGTTILSYVLAQDPQRRSLLRWEAAEPCPPPGVDPEADSERIARVRKQIARQHEVTPELAAINIQEPEGPTECVLTLSHEFKSLLFDCSLFIPSFYAWNKAADQVSAYEHHRATLQLLQWHRPPNRWHLKAPAHTLSLEALVDVYPDARFVVIHRDPVTSLASACHFWEVQMGGFSDDVDTRAVGRHWLGIYVDALDALHRFLTTHDSQSVIELRYDELRDPLGAVRRIYERFAIPLSATAESRMHEFMATHRPGQHGRHEYSLERYGLEPEVVAATFRPYVEALGIETVR